ncbi:endonuclease/exonuclease/phosphatase family protein [Mariniflexile litorale]|uniref:Endonuclease/exonuclease/phosphatase family protein n=1 Tax=Mariniflexile litorale TaxID=3045158 RepID=A0AAU7ED51_9FLAO|nr:endonuclease/exonuclease/phosphatase family protein [Mariniflexile sp. KMM 9835]MDQ8212112.1 endonuclease/exonuclease/phosphatase family protein [Mariniflexile sp. KMM 9835]
MKQLVITLFAFLNISLHAQELSVMTYNIKLDFPKEGENSWTKRRPFFINQLKFHEPDVWGVQEAMPNQMKEIDSLLVDYNFIGVGRDNGRNEGEYSAIFYKADQFEVLKSSTFWLSDTPEKVSMGWDAVCNRVCTYGLFKNLKTKKTFWVFNTHFDHVGTKARIESAKLILNKIKLLNTKSLPVILMGDFNMESQHESIQYISQILNDSKSIANNTFGPSGTFNNFEFHKPVTRRIDYIFLSDDLTINKYAVLSDSKDCHYPSDHLPVYVKITITD